jgi:hypothetical protein
MERAENCWKNSGEKWNVTSANRIINTYGYTGSSADYVPWWFALASNFFDYFFCWSAEEAV